MISNDLLQSNYLGRDGFKWWVGQVADPDTSGWGNAKESQNKRRFKPDDQEDLEHDVYERRCKVRILGYHTISDKDGYVLKDSDLPWAHILVPAGTGTGIHGIGGFHEYQGGENVLGFFLDGDDAQQPVIIGGFGRGPQVGDVEDTTKLSEKTDGVDCIVKPYKPRLNASTTKKTTLKQIHLQKEIVSTDKPETANNPAKEETDPLTGRTKTVYRKSNESGTKDTASGGSSKENANQGAKAQEKDIKLERPSCSPDENILGSIQIHLLGAIKTLKSLRQYKQQFFDPTVSQLTSLSNQIGGYVKVISGYIRKLFEVIKGELVKQLNKVWTEAQKFLSETFKPILGLTFNELLEFIICVFEEILGEGIFDAVFDIISGKIFGDIIDAALCAVEDILADILNKFLQPILDAISGSLKALADLLNSIGGQFEKAISEALNFIGRILSFFKCAPERFQCNSPASWSLDGPEPTAVSSYINVLNKIKIPDIPLPPGFDNLSRSALRCDANIGYLFPPEVKFSFGNARAKAFVGDGSVIGIYLEEPGKGYSKLTPPAISIKQPGVYGTGGGAKAVAMVGDDGGIERICLTSPGTGYVATPEVAETSIAEISEDDFSLLPLPKTSSQVDAIPYLKEIYIKSPGTGYNDNDSILINGKDPSEFGLKFDIDTGPGGFITRINIQNNNNTPPVFKNLPQISVLSDTGFGVDPIGCLGFIIVESQEKDNSGNIIATTADGQTITVNASDILTSVNCFLQ